MRNILTPLLTFVATLLVMFALVSASSVSASPHSTSYTVNVFYSKAPTSLNDSTAVFAVSRQAPDLGVASYAIGELIAGPTPAEQQAGYFSELNEMFSGPSNCMAQVVGGPDFKLAVVSGKATLQFCRMTSSGGIGADARVKAEIDATLLQFPTIKQVVILTSSGHCFGDLSGLDRCLL